MRAMRDWAGKGSGGALSLLLFGLLLRAMVPTGWMPAGDGLSIRPCLASGNALALITAPDPAPAARIGSHDNHQDGADAAHHGHHAGTDHEGGDHRGHPEQPCSFAGLTAPLAPPAGAAALAPPPEIVAAAPPSGLAHVLGRGLAAPPPPATGPPSLG